MDHLRIGGKVFGGRGGLCFVVLYHGIHGGKRHLASFGIDLIDDVSIAGRHVEHRHTAHDKNGTGRKQSQLEPDFANHRQLTGGTGALRHVS